MVQSPWVVTLQLVFSTEPGRPWIHVTPGKLKVDAETNQDIDLRHGSGTITITDLIAQNIGRLVAKLGVEKCGGFYCLRRTTQTVGEGCGDSAAVAAIMGHAPGIDTSRWHRIRHQPR
jgi:hypothetical protein